MTPTPAHPASFRDPSGFIYERGGVLLRQVNRCYAETFQAVVESGLFDQLIADGRLIGHETADLSLAASSDAAIVLRPRRLATVSYPYEWCFSELKDAALLTLNIQRQALDAKMSLKDASAYNVQFELGRPVFIDTLSFEPYESGTPWIAYRQFCRHFLAPLALMATVDVGLGDLLRLHLDGVPLDLAARLLPWKTKLNPGLAMHLHAHARSERTGQGTGTARAHFSELAMRGLIDSLEGTIRRLDWTPTGTVWADYYTETNYTSEAMEAKVELVRQMLAAGPLESCWDLGANTGEFSRVAAEMGAATVAWDFDPAAVEKAYRQVREHPMALLPLRLDLMNPSPAQGWAGSERDALADRGPVDMVMALALIHHLAIGNNVPLALFVEFLARLGRRAIVEFVPKEDSQVQRLLVARKDVFAEYDAAHFESALAGHFAILRREPIEGTHRTLYLLERQR